MSNVQRIRTARKCFATARRFLVLANQGKVSKGQAMSMYNKARNNLRNVCKQVRGDV